jgi:hypothetical protein
MHTLEKNIDRILDFKQIFFIFNHFHLSWYGNLG